MKPIILILVILSISSTSSFGQKSTSLDTYIPVNLVDCFNELDKVFSDSSKTKIKNMSEDEFSAQMHLGFGTSIRNNWGLWKGSRLSEFFNKQGIFHPEDMSGIIFTSYSRYLKGQQLKMSEQIKFYQDYWEKTREMMQIKEK